MSKSKLTVCAIIAAFVLTGCADMSETQKKTATGAGIGAAVGAIAGVATGHGGWKRAAAGAAIGGLIGGGAGYLWGANMEKQKQELEQANQNTGVSVVQTADNQIKLNVPGDLSFATNSSTISAQGKKVLDNLAASLNKNPGTTIKILGYTDSTGTASVNQTLSAQRAKSVKDYLISKGVAASRMTSAGLGSADPVASNQTAQGRLLNRRVEIFIAQPAQ